MAFVFSAHAEVVPLLAHIKTPPACILRARGGSSNEFEELEEIFGILRARGGSSDFVTFIDVQRKYSPRTRR